MPTPPLPPEPASQGHTPGPFAVESVFQIHPLDIVLDYEIPGAGSPIVIGTTFHDDDRDGPITLTQAKANARLFASAPALFDALQLALHVRGTSDDTPEVRNIMEAALAAAKCPTK